MTFYIDLGKGGEVLTYADAIMTKIMRFFSRLSTNLFCLSQADCFSKLPTNLIGIIDWSVKV